MMVPFLGREATCEAAKQVLDLIVTKGNAKEVFLKCVQGLKRIQYERSAGDDDDTLVEKLAQTTLEDVVDPVTQTTELYEATINGAFSLQSSCSLETYQDSLSFTIPHDFGSGAFDEYHPCVSHFG